MTDNNHIVERCQSRFKYEYDNCTHYYTPDFIVDGTNIIEVKGYEVDRDKYKYNSVKNLWVLYFNDIKHMIEYCKITYNVDDLSLLYEA